MGNASENETIHLDQFLKTCGVSTGGQAKLLIQGGDVMVNGETETRRRRQLRAGDEVALGEDVFVVSEIERDEWNGEGNSAAMNADAGGEIENEGVECIDIGANLTHKSFQRDLPKVVLEARKAGVSKIVLTGSNERSSIESAKVCKAYPGFFYATAGVHPHDAKSFNNQSKVILEELYQLPQVVAIGECGLDFNRDLSPRDAQVTCFEEQLAMAKKVQLPMFLHERDAFETLVEIMRRHRDSISQAVVHCFTGSEEAMKAYLDMDLHIGITGWICDERRGVHLRELVKQIPVNRLMIETDSPYLAPRDIRPKIQRNEPKYLPHILQTIADCRNEDVNELGPQLAETTCEFFGL